MSQPWWKDDDQLLAALGEALRSESSVPAEFTATGTAAFARRGIDAELAALTHDPAVEGAEAEPAGVRTEPATLRHLTFASAELTVEIEVSGDALLGQLVPPGPGRAEACTANGTTVTAVTAPAAGFPIRPLPP